MSDKSYHESPPVPKGMNKVPSKVLGVTRRCPLFKGVCEVDFEEQGVILGECPNRVHCVKLTDIFTSSPTGAIGTVFGRRTTSSDATNAT